MNPERRQLIAQLFENALDRDPELRNRFLREACQDDPDLFESVVALLQADEDPHRALGVLGPLGDDESPGESGAETIALDSDAAFRAGQVIGDRYRIEGLLGQGGMGEVWRAFDLRLRVDIALKSMRRDRLWDDSTFDFLRREVLAARDVISPNVCRIFDLAEADGREFLSMEYVDGTTLLEVLRNRGPLDLREALEIASQFLTGLDAIHGAGLVHRDVKPENIMITRSGRVILMDLGLAKPEVTGGTIAGTPAYMAPEQARGQSVDGRADIFAAGVVLAEMIAAQGVREHASRENIHRGAHLDPPELPESPWRPVLKRAVSRDPNLRHGSARELIRALEHVAVRVEGMEEVNPYPGLSAFSEADAEYFFGREAEVESLWKKLQESHLLALIGPSGAGKSSFLRAGLIPARPEGWRTLICHPGDAPMVAIGEALAPELSGDAEAVRQMIRFDDVDVAVELFSRWRRRHEQTLLIVDQFEELFTLNPLETQSRFADFLRRLTLDADVRVLISMRDDFVMRCHGFGALAPIFSELTPLDPPAGAALRRALVQPALLCGYRFEDDALVDDMLEEVIDERGALPLLAFAVSQLWARRDRGAGLLTRDAYQQIGGVGGALARHAEATLERIGSDRLPVVREMFRNLITAHGTRAARRTEDLLSVFEDRAEAEEVLLTVIDARLLTSYETETGEADEGKRIGRVEIIHESLLTAWPRLIRWQTQDADSAQLRDQVRQAAHLWQERGQSDELLWSGSAFQEFQLWRERYPGGLTDTEDAFGRAMVARTERRRRQRRLVYAGVIAALLVVVGVVGGLWRQSVAEARRAEAGELVALGRGWLAQGPTVALAHAIASLERTDTPDARRLALEALWKGPTYSVPPPEWDAKRGRREIAFSDDGHWLAVGGHVYGQNDDIPSDLGQGRDYVWHVQFATVPDLLWYDRRGKSVELISIPGAELVRVFADPYPGGPLFLTPDRLITQAVQDSSEVRRVIRSWPVTGTDHEVLGEVESDASVIVDPTGTWIGSVKGPGVFIQPLEGLTTSEPRLVGWHEDLVERVCFDRTGSRLASFDCAGKIRIWSTDPGETAPLRTLSTGDRDIRHLQFDGSGTFLASFNSDCSLWLWDLDGPPAAEPLTLLGLQGEATHVAADPRGRWLATVSHPNVPRDHSGPDPSWTCELWPLTRKYPRLLVGHTAYVMAVAFAPDGSWLVSGSWDGTVRRWPMVEEAGESSEVLLDVEGSIQSVAVDPRGRYVLGAGGAGVHLIPLNGEPTQALPGMENATSVTTSPDGRYVAAWIGRRGSIRVHDLELGTQRDFEGKREEGGLLMYGSLVFTADGRLLSDAGAGRFHVWSPDNGSHEVLEGGAIDLGPDRRLLLMSDGRIPHLLDTRTGAVRPIPSREAVLNMALDAHETILVTSGLDGVVRVGPVSGAEPHLLLGHELTVYAIAVSPDGRWIATAGTDLTIRLWPMPEGEPLHSLAHEELCERLRALTNLRVVENDAAETGYHVDVAQFDGWATTPTW